MRAPERGSPNGLDAFMTSLGALESGNNYDAVGPYTGSTYGRARGRFQIMEKIYPAWAREAGVDPNDYSPAAQDRVARHKMSQYYARYGSWELVAIAWFAGPGRADKAKREGISSVGGISDMLGTSVSSYVSKVMGGMGNQTHAEGTAKAGRDNPKNARIGDVYQPLAERTAPPNWFQRQRAATLGRGSFIEPIEAAPGTVLTEQQQQTRDDQITQDALGSIMATISEAAKGKSMTLDARSFFGMPKFEQSLVEGLSSQEEAVPADLSTETVQPGEGGPLAPPPQHDGFAPLQDNAKTGAQRLMAQFPGLTFTSGYRDPGRNAAAGGVRTSKHLTGEATDFDGDPAEMERAAQWAKANGAVKAFVHQDGDGEGVHLHIEWG